MDGFSDAESFYDRFLKNLRLAWTVMAPVVATDGVCRLQELDEVAGRPCCFCLPFLPLKKILLPPSELLWSFEAGSYKLPPATPSSAGVALIDVAACDLYALAYLDQAYAEDPFYQERRQRLLLIGRECSPSSYCHCPPHADPPPFDLFFAGQEAWCGSALGEKVLQEVAGAMATKGEAALPIQYWAGQMALPPDLSERFIKSADDPLWAVVARRCLSCGACSAVCPTCACYDVVDAVSLSGEIKRQRFWDNCFFRDHGLVAGGHNFRPDRTARLRFRFEHKYLGFGAQRGSSSCVGCGRCQQACPVGINMADVLEQLPALEEE